MVPWNDIVVMSPVVMMSVAQEPSEGEAMFEEQAGCLPHDADRMKPIVYQTWRPGSQGGCTERSAIIAETQVSNILHFAPMCLRVEEHAWRGLSKNYSFTAEQGLLKPYDMKI